MSPNDQGFVLVEILSSLVIVGIAAIAFLQLMSVSADRTHQANSERGIQVLAEKLLADERLKLAADFGERGGETEDGRFSWSVSVTPLDSYPDSNTEQPILAQIHINVNTQKPDRYKPVELTLIHAFGHGS